MFSCSEDTRTKKNEKIIHLGSKQPYSYNNQEYMYSYNHKSSDSHHKTSSFHKKKRIFEEEPKRASPYNVTAYYQTGQNTQNQGNFLQTPTNFQYNYANPHYFQHNYASFAQAQPNLSQTPKENYNYQQNYAQNYQAFAPAYPATTSFQGNMRESIKGDSEISFIPFERSYYEQVPMQKVEYIPQERRFTDYYAIERQREYVPVSRMEAVEKLVPEERIEYVPQKRLEYVPQPRTEMVPVERVREKVELHPMETNIVHYPKFQGQFYEEAEGGGYWENRGDWRETPPPPFHQGEWGNYRDFGEGVREFPENFQNYYPGNWEYRERAPGFEQNYYEDSRDNYGGFYGNRYDLDLRYRPFERNRNFNDFADGMAHRHMNNEYI